MKTVFGSLNQFEKGRVEVINDNAKNYAFSNVFEICSKAKPYEKVVMAINQIYVLEAIRAEGTSAWFSCAHDEFILSMDGEVEVHLVKLEHPAISEPEKNGAIQLAGEAVGRKMGWMNLKRGHQGMLPANSAYQFRAAKPAALVLQTTLGDLSVQKWAQICQTA